MNWDLYSKQALEDLATKANPSLQHSIFKKKVSNSDFFEICSRQLTPDGLKTLLERMQIYFVQLQHGLTFVSFGIDCQAALKHFPGNNYSVVLKKQDNDDHLVRIDFIEDFTTQKLDDQAIESFLKRNTLKQETDDVLLSGDLTLYKDIRSFPVATVER